MSCEEVRLELGEVAEGLAKLSQPARRHVRTCERCEGFKQQLRDPVRVMPAYSQAVVSDKEAADIYAFLQTLSGRRPVKDFPILNN